MITESEKKFLLKNFPYMYSEYTDWFNQISFWYFKENYKSINYISFYVICNFILEEVCENLKKEGKFESVKEDSIPKNIDELFWIELMVCDLVDSGIPYSSFIEFMNTFGSNKEVHDFIYKYIYEKVLCFI